MISAIPSFIWFVFILAAVVLFHELGHFVAGRAAGIRVLEFAFGMGPVLWAVEKNGVRYALRAFPIGGQCVFEGEDDGDPVEESDEKHISYASVQVMDNSEDGVYGNVGFGNEKTKRESTGKRQEYRPITDEELSRITGKSYSLFNEAGIWGRIATVFAGPLFNFILAFVISMIITGFAGIDTPVITDLAPEGAAAMAGLESGDKIVKIDGRNIFVYRQISILSQLNTTGEPFTVVYERNGERNTVILQPLYDEETGRYYMGLYGSGVTENNLNPLHLVKGGLYEVRYWIDITGMSLKMLFGGSVSVREVSGPVGIAGMVNDTYQEASQYGMLPTILTMLNFMVLISVNLGVMNLLPFPALDGGRLVFMFIELIFGKPVPRDKEGWVHMAGMAVLMVFMVVVLFSDILKLFNKI